jgi:hypothetical protein
MKRIKIKVAYKLVKYPGISVEEILAAVEIPVTNSIYKLTCMTGLFSGVRKSVCNGNKTVNNYIRFCIPTKKVLTSKKIMKELENLIPDTANILRMRYVLKISEEEKLDRYPDNPYVILGREYLLVKEADIYDVIGKIL